MSLFNVLDVSGSGMRAQSIRLNTVASNLANAESVSSTAEGAYRSKQPIFKAMLHDGINGATAGVEVTKIVQKETAPRRQYMPEHPMADDTGHIYYSNVNSVEEMANMISASRAYQNNIEAMNTVKQLMMRTINLGN